MSADANALLAHVDDAFVTELAARLIAVPGHEDLPSRERDVAVALRDALAEAGLPAALAEIPEGRANVTGAVRGPVAGPRLLLTGHLDTVPGYGMADAFRPRVDGGRLHGRGAVDMKGALASMAGALLALHRAGGPARGELALAAVAGEESGSAGTLHLAEDGPLADLAIVGEPTRLDVVLAHKGSTWIDVELTGRAAHGSRPELGVNAIAHAARFLVALEERLVPRLRTRVHPLLGSPTLSVGTIHGGDRTPMVAARCVVTLDRRWIPGEERAGVLEEVRDVLRALDADAPALRWRVTEGAGTAGFVHGPLDCPRDTPGVPELMAAVAAVTGRPARALGAAYWTDAALLMTRGATPAVVCGPGDIAQAHSDAEYVELDQLRAATRVYLLTAARMLGARQPG